MAKLERFATLEERVNKPVKCPKCEWSGKVCDVAMIVNSCLLCPVCSEKLVRIPEVKK